MSDTRITMAEAVEEARKLGETVRKSGLKMEDVLEGSEQDGLGRDTFMPYDDFSATVIQTHSNNPWPSVLVTRTTRMSAEAEPHVETRWYKPSE